MKHYANELVNYYEKLGYYAKADYQDDDDMIDGAVAAINVADNLDFDHFYKDDSHTGMFFFYYPLDDGFFVHINTIVTSAADRGKGVAKRFIHGLFKVFGDRLRTIELNDETDDKSFWQHMSRQFPDVEWIID